MVDFAKHLKKAPRIDLNPSAAARWTTCTASPRFIFDNWEKVPSQDTFYTQEGTTAHEVAAAMLEDRKPDLAKCPTAVTPDMLWYGFEYAEYVRSLIKKDAQLWVETKLPLFYMESRNAIVDVAIRNPDEVHIVDYKYGAGVVVDPEENLQGIIYAKSLLWTTVCSPKTPVFIHIYQPRARDAGETPYRVWETTYGHINGRAVDITTKARLIQSDGNFYTEFTPSEEACQWCPAKGFCDARRGELTKDIEVLATIEPGPMHLPPAASISVKQLIAVLEHGEQINKWLKDVQDYALQFLKGGGKIDGYKLVQSRGGNRYWSNPAVAAKLMLESTILRKEEVYKTTVIGPAEAEKKLGKHKFNAQLTNLIARPPGVPVIAPAGDKREELTINAETEFTALEDVEL